MPKPMPTDPTAKATALLLADEIGPAAASRQLGIPASTLRAWRSREKASAPARSSSSTPASSSQRTAAEVIAGSVDELIAMGRSMMQTAEKARRAAEKAIGQGKSTGVRDLSLATGILLDQASKLQAGAERLEHAKAEVDRQQADLLADRLAIFSTALSLPFDRDSACRRLLDVVLRDGSAPEPLALQARAELRRSIQGERLALPRGESS